MPLWLATPMRPAGGYGATIWAHSLTGVLTTPCPFGPASRMPSSSHERDQLGLGRSPSLARLAVAGGRHERGRRALGGARPQQVEVGRRRRAHHDEVDRVVGQLGDVGDASGCRAPSSPWQVGAEHPALVAGGQQVVHRDEPELAGMRRGAGDEHAAGLEQRRELRPSAVAATAAAAPSSAARSPSSTSASTAIGTPSGLTISGLTSTLSTSGRSARPRPSADEDRRQRVAIDRRLAAERSEQPLGRQLVDHLVGRDVVERRRAEHDVGDGLGEDAAESEHHGRRRTADRAARRRSARGCRGSSARRAASTCAVVRRGGGEQRRRPQRRTAAASPRSQPDEAPLGLVGDGVTVELDDHREPELGRCGDRLVDRRRPPFTGNRHPEPGEQRPSTRIRTGCATPSAAKVPTRHRRRCDQPGVWGVQAGPARRTGRAPPVPRRTVVGTGRRTCVSRGRRRSIVRTRCAACADARRLPAGTCGETAARSSSVTWAKSHASEKRTGPVATARSVSVATTQRSSALEGPGDERGQQRALRARAARPGRGPGPRRGRWPCRSRSAPAPRPNESTPSASPRSESSSSIVACGRRRARRATDRRARRGRRASARSRCRSARGGCGPGLAKPLNHRSSAFCRRRSVAADGGEGGGELGALARIARRTSVAGSIARSGGGWFGGGGSVVHEGIRFRASVTGRHSSSVPCMTST